VNDIKVEIGMD
jgi:hypothetical protein